MFELIPSAGPWGQTFYTERVLHSFCSQGGGYCTDGANPILWKLFMDPSGSLYGTTIYGGANSTYLGAREVLVTHRLPATRAWCSS